MKIIAFKDGRTAEITGEAGKYWMTGETRVRKLSGSIAEIRETEEPAEKKTKKTGRKKKTEDEADGDCGG